MQSIFSSPYVHVYHYKEHQILHIKWAEIAEDMSSEDFKHHITTFVEKVKEYKVRGFIIDSLKGHFIMNISIQEWHDKEIVPHYLANNIEKIAIILPEKDFFALVSLQQAFDEAQAQKLQRKLFQNIEEAIEWMKV
jgi:hypothetical protein